MAENKVSLYKDKKYGKKRIIFDSFPSISNLLSTLEKLPNNKIMRNEHSSNEKDVNFTKTKSYEEACSLLKYGYEEILSKIIKETKETLSTNIINLIPAQTPPKNLPVGYIPNVPNSLLNLPNSMINILREPKKTKSISIYYCFGDNCGEDAENFITAGVALVSAINLIEKAGIRTRLYVGFMPAYKSNEITFPTLKLKDFQDNFNLKKLCFPLIHPSMFRRIGFKWLETSPDITEDSFSWGYGSPLTEEEEQVITNFIQEKNKNAYFISYKWMKQKDFKIEPVLKLFNVIK